MKYASLKSLAIDRLSLRPAVLAATFFYVRALRTWKNPHFRSRLRRVVSWTLVATVYGLLVGSAAVLAPPMASIFLAALVALVLFWVLPDLPSAPLTTLRRVFYATIFAELLFPAYYMVQIPSLPWISIRRIFVVILISMFLFCVSVSRNARKVVASTLYNDKVLLFCIVGFIVMAFLSIFFSTEPIFSLSQFLDALLNWYFPFFACLLVVRSEKEIIRFYRAVALLTLFIALIGTLDFLTESMTALSIIPKTILSAMLDANPSLAAIVNASPYRNGHYRATSIYNTPLSFGELAAMIAPIGGYFILHGRRALDRAFGSLVLGAAMVSLFVSGSRGGSVAFVVSMPMVLFLWVIRYTRTHRRSMIAPIFTMVSALGTTAVIGTILLWKRLHHIVFGGGDTAASDESRSLQWELGLKHIYANPIFGHGLGRAAETVDYHNPGGQLSIDSYALSLVVETGIPGLLLYFGMIVVTIGVMVHVYLKDRDAEAEIAAPLAASLLAYGVYRLVLSQRENQTLFFIFLALAYVVAEASRNRLAASQRRPVHAS